MEGGYTCQVTFGIEGKAIINRLVKFNSKDDAFIFVEAMDFKLFLSFIHECCMWLILLEPKHFGSAAAI